MIIFINDVPVRMYRPDESPANGQFNQVIDASLETITHAKLIHHIWIQNAREKDLDILLNFLNSPVPTALLSLHISPFDYEGLKAYLQSKFKVIKAAGGL
ncbi:MAG TPA: hypothetical protein VFM90_11030, partial [Cyclobacteriaceae bacterium]|nr:hypothetical protein [Cyclobacteriaceae bacterium]